MRILPQLFGSASAVWAFSWRPSRRRHDVIYAKNDPRTCLSPWTEEDSFLDDDESSSMQSWDTALAVVPPDEAWDRLQRARHTAQDATYAIWPPALRLLHPFAPRPPLSVGAEDLHAIALQIAEIVEQYQVAAFNITLSQWSILPHTERMPTYLSLSSQPDKIFRNQEDRDVQALIAKEERIGKEKMHLRREKQRRKQSDATTEMAMETTASPPNPRTPAAVYNGPCVICVEPDQESREKLQALQYLLQRALPPWARRAAALYSPTGSTALESHQRRVSRSHSSRDFRPVVPIGAFPNVAAAIPVARRLRQQWTPLTFEVTDLHLLSTTGGSRRNGPWGCDALVALGELDDENDDDDTQATTDMVQMVCALGEPGGFFQNATTQATQVAAAADLERWLDGGGEEEEEDDDNGTVVVLGRTQLFTGAMRQYVGMPAPRLSWEVAPRLSWHAES